MPQLQHPETGAHVTASRATADALIEQGWTEVTKAQTSSESVVEQKSGKKKPTSEPKAKTGDGETPETEKPLDKMGLKELIEHAEKLELPADQLDELRKPGTSKAKAKSAIEAHLAATAE